ncbi:hypothetical protein [Brevundimonas sp. PAMC22021]|uniref:hypothetical protein n=1 Tax=Brevundimonas sp. PAMC22021 TaxID=2861285 RepID=UPI001C62F6C0|nr:hypothetical protein [Brevundimonas sp. PAMC22021]QYF87505.1 hypothetical protein KY493_03065 [Brevundimonas sp. PAMC22021]
MAEPGDNHDHDAEIGFASAASLRGQQREDARTQAPGLVPTAGRHPRPSVRDLGVRATTAAGVSPELYAVYILILLAVPTIGVSAVIGLLAVRNRSMPDNALEAGHFVFQRRTLWIAAAAAALGVVLIIVNVGVIVLFLAAVWVLVRGAFGVFKLKAGQPINRPGTWLI